MAITTSGRSAPAFLARRIPAWPGRLRSFTLAAAATLLGRPLLRLCLGRWPSGDEARRFTAGLGDRATNLPPLCRALLPVPAARAHIGRMLLFDMARRGELAANDPFDLIGAASPAGSLPPQAGNPLQFWHGPPVAFLHLEKTAGVSVATLLTDMFHPQQIDPDPARTLAPHVAMPFAGRDPSAIRRRALIYGHYDLPSLRRLDPDRVIITMLRDPADRILSLYYYWRSIDLTVLRGSAGHAAVRLAHRCGLLDFLSTDDPLVRDHIDNFYVRRLTGLYVTGAKSDRLADAPEFALSMALRGLRQIDFVGVTEEMALSVAGLGACLGFIPPATIPQENTASANATMANGVFRAVPREPLTPAHWRQLGRLSRLDAVLYRIACDRLATHGGVSPHRHADQLASDYPGAA